MENREISPFQAILTCFFSMNRKVSMFKCGLTRICPKSVTYPKIMGCFLWSAVTENRAFITNRTSDNDLKRFSYNDKSHSKSGRVRNLITVEESSQP